MTLKAITPKEQERLSSLRKQLEDEAEKLFDQSQTVDKLKMRFGRAQTELARKYRLKGDDEIDVYGAIIREKEKRAEAKAKAKEDAPA